MVDEVGSMAVVSYENKAQHLIVAIEAIVAKEVNKIIRLKESRMYLSMYSRMYSRI
jgi:hypothetical protein